MNTMIENQEKLRYVIMVNGNRISVPFLTEQAAVQHLSHLPQDQQILAEIVPITQDDKQLLLG